MKTSEFYKTILSQINAEKNFEVILAIASNHTKCSAYHEILATEDYSKMLLTGNYALDLRYKNAGHNRRILVVSCLESILDLPMITQLADIINFMRTVQVILLVPQKATDVANKDSKILTIFESCKQLYMLNVLLWFEDFATTLEFYQFTQFPSLQLEKRLYAPNMTEPFYPNRLNDLKGSELRTLADHIEPRSIEYYDKKGNLQLNGYVGKFVTAFAKKHNARLVFPYQVPQNEMVFYRDFLHFTRNFSLDLPTSITTMLIDDSFEEHSYPLEQANWCILLPEEEPIEFNLLYLTILRSNFMATAFVLIIVFTLVLLLALVLTKPAMLELNWSQLLLNDVAVRGVLGQGFVYYVSDHSYVLTLIYCCIFTTGLIINTLFGAYLQSFLTQAPTEPFIHNYQDMLDANLKILISPDEYSYLMNFSIVDMKPYESLYKVLPTYAEFYSTRDTFDRSYGYPTTTARWPFYKSLQEFYSVKIFRYSFEMCPTPVLQLCFALPLNSVYREPLEKLILQVHQAGLISFWLASIYYEKMDLGRNVKIDIIYKPPHRPLTVWDLYWIWILYLVMIGSCILVFGMEFLMGLRQKRVKRAYATDDGSTSGDEFDVHSIE